ncbi:uncharacterized protein LOC122079661 [Macadamia integrifolia]|uniref:uncharacterized protein LOC122079661 n=1 Tax=Macadamia integrifolia TaxID=60698 RepID=UPI001C4FA251|nr:uncharacterized protein LOC122079661 [Macadamia integrifolia]
MAILWDRQDQLILSWIISSLSESTISHVVSATTSSDAWNILARVFAPSFRTRLIGDEDLVLAVLRGLGSEYRDFATSIRFRVTPVSFVELSGLLLSHENFLKSSDLAISDVTTANKASTQNLSSGSRRSSGYRGNRYRGNQYRSNRQPAYYDQNH